MTQFKIIVSLSMAVALISTTAFAGIATKKGVERKTAGAQATKFKDCQWQGDEPKPAAKRSADDGVIQVCKSKATCSGEEYDLVCEGVLDSAQVYRAFKCPSATACANADTPEYTDLPAPQPPRGGGGGGGR